MWGGYSKNASISLTFEQFFFTKMDDIVKDGGQTQDLSGFLKVPENEDTLKRMRKMYENRLREVEALNSNFSSPTAPVLNSTRLMQDPPNPKADGIRIASDPMKSQRYGYEKVSSRDRHPFSRSSAASVREDRERANRSLDIDYDRGGLASNLDQFYRNDRYPSAKDGAYHGNHVGLGGDYKSMNPSSNIGIDEGRNNNGFNNYSTTDRYPSSSAAQNLGRSRIESSLPLDVEEIMRDLHEQRRLISSLESRASRAEFRLQDAESSNRRLREKISFLEGRVAQLEDSLSKIDFQQLQLQAQIRAIQLPSSSTHGVGIQEQTLTPSYPSDYYNTRPHVVDSSSERYGNPDNYRTSTRPRESGRLSIMGEETANLLRPYRD